MGPHVCLSDGRRALATAIMDGAKKERNDKFVNLVTRERHWPMWLGDHVGLSDNSGVNGAPLAVTCGNWPTRAFFTPFRECVHPGAAATDVAPHLPDCVSYAAFCRFCHSRNCRDGQTG